MYSIHSMSIYYPFNHCLSICCQLFIHVFGINHALDLAIINLSCINYPFTTHISPHIVLCSSVCYRCTSNLFSMYFPFCHHCFIHMPYIYRPIFFFIASIYYQFPSIKFHISVQMSKYYPLFSHYIQLLFIWLYALSMYHPCFIHIRILSLFYQLFIHVLSIGNPSSKMFKVEKRQCEIPPPTKGQRLGPKARAAFFSIDST